MFAARRYTSPGDPARSGLLGVSVLSLPNEKWTHLSSENGLPQESVTAITVNGRQVWIGGFGFIALLDPAYQRVLKFAYVPGEVDRLGVAGGYLWVQFKKHLYRVPLSSIN
jgi:hypothetical protein